jgi:hypothetical protein
VRIIFIGTRSARHTSTLKNAADAGCANSRPIQIHPQSGGQLPEAKSSLQWSAHLMVIKDLLYNVPINSIRLTVAYCIVAFVLIALLLKKILPLNLIVT